MFQHIGIRHFTVMQRLLKVRLPLLAALDDPSQKKYSHLLLRDKQWSLMEELVEVLDPVEVATTALIMSGQQYATASLVLPMMTNLVKSLTKPTNVYSSTVKSVRSTLAAELQAKYALSDLRASSPLVLATALDPRFRSLAISLYMSFGEDDVKLSVHTSTMELASTQPKGNSPEPKAERPACSKRLD